MREKITACITAFNEETRIGRCLESIKWADEIVVVDSFSADNTVEICRKYTDRVYRHEWLGYIGQKNLIKEMASNPWILFIDADEEVSPALRGEILGEFDSFASSGYAGYEFPRMVKYIGRWIKHGDWYPDVKLRLFRKASGQCEGVEPHDRVSVSGRLKRLKGDLYHYTHQNLRDHVAATNKFSTITASGWYKERRPFRLHHLIFRPPLRFLRCYILRRGFMDGPQGFIIATMVAFGVFMKYAKLWQYYREGRMSEEPPSH